MNDLSSVINRSNLPCYQAIAKGYRTGDFTDFIPYLTDETVFESHWVFVPMEGKKEISKYLVNKGKAFIQYGCKMETQIVKCINGVGGVVVKQILSNGETDDMFIQLSFNNEGKLARVDLNPTGFYRFHLLKDGEI